MTSKERVLVTFQFKEPDQVPCWCGASPEFLANAREKLNVDNEGFLQRIGEDFRRITAEYVPPTGKLSQDIDQFGIRREGIGYGQAMNHPLANATMEEILAYPWPNPDHVDISSLRREASLHVNNYAILGGDWSPFWHNALDMFGMENMFIKMFTEPELVEMVFKKVVDYYVGVNERIFAETADLIDVFFIGNDFGSQIGPLIGEDQFERFIVPHLKRLADLGHAYKLKVMLHCCGGFREYIPYMIAAGIDAVHAIQPSCRGMELAGLKKDFGQKIVFNGCIDSQFVLIDGNPATVREQTRAVLQTMKPGGAYIAGASHDYILEETPLDNVLAMFDAIHEFGKY